MGHVPGQDGSKPATHAEVALREIGAHPIKFRLRRLILRRLGWNIHLHCLVLDGVYQRSDGDPVFVEVPAPTDEGL